MKKLFLSVVLLTALGFTACDDDDNGNGPSSINDGKIEGRLTIVSYDIYDDEYEIKGSVTDEVDEIVLSAIGYDNIENSILEKYTVSNGEFAILLPTSLSAKYLWNIAENFEEEDQNETINMIVSDKDAKMGAIWFASYKNNMKNGYVGKESFSNGFYDGEVRYVYVDRSVTVKGTYKYEYKYGDNTEIDIQNYDFKFNKGWNTTVGRRTISKTETTYTETWNYTANSSESSMIWTVEFDDYNYPNSSLKSVNPDMKKSKGFSKKFFGKQ